MKPTFPALPRLMLTAALALLTSNAFAQQNTTAQFALDFAQTDADTRVSSTIETDAVVTNSLFSATLVLKGAASLTGLSVDLRFDPAVLKVLSISEKTGDVNFDGRSNIADVLTLAERFNATVSSDTNPEYRYFDVVPSGVIDSDDINALMAKVNQGDLFWTSNPDASGFGDYETYPESVEVFEDPEVSNAKGLIDDIAVVLLPRQHPPQETFGFTGDARVAEIQFQFIGGISGSTTTLSFEDPVIIDAKTVVNDDGTLSGESRPDSPSVTIQIP
ncbi:MAG: hypothetical protein GC154_21510 [bacterium]|nr:hypothetical protein [bacterium]